METFHLSYKTKSNADYTFNLFGKMLKARDKLNSQYPGDISCKVIPPSNGWISIEIEEKRAGASGKAVEEYFSIVDASIYPFAYVGPKSDFSLAEKFLPGGKELKRKFETLYMGKHVIDSHFGLLKD